MRPPINPRSRTIDLQMTPMIDVVFLLLVFFLWTSNFEVPEHDLSSPVALSPKGTTSIDAEPPPALYDEIIIRLLNVGDRSPAEIRFNDQVVADAATLAERLREVTGLGAQPPVIVYPDSEVAMGEAIAVYDAIRAAGVDQVMFAVQEK
jgi:biopolymer transport protein ExbD